MAAFSATTVSSVLALAVLAVSFAAAHVTLQPTTANINSYAISMVTVPHGCSGAATTSIALQVPANVTSVKPQLVAGWTCAITMRPLVPAITGEGGSVINTTVDTVTWSGGSIPDNMYFQFGLQWKTPATAGARILFPINQTCDNGNTTSWTQVPANASQNGALPYPAPGVTLVDPTAAANSTATAAKSGAQKLSGANVVAVAGAIGVLSALWF